MGEGEGEFLGKGCIFKSPETRSFLETGGKLGIMARNEREREAGPTE